MAFSSDSEALHAAMRLLFELLLEGTATPALRARTRAFLEVETLPLHQRRVPRRAPDTDATLPISAVKDGILPHCASVSPQGLHCGLIAGHSGNHIARFAASEHHWTSSRPEGTPS